jgi:hypothetical protein
MLEWIPANCQQNQWVNPVALADIAWKYYIVYIVLISMYLVLIYFFFPETRRLTIEEVSVIFDTGRLGNASAAAQTFVHGPRDGKILHSQEDGDKEAGVAEVERRESV